MAKTKDGQDLFWVVSTTPHVRHNKARCAEEVARVQTGVVQRVVGAEVAEHRRLHGEAARNRCSRCWPSTRWNEVR